MAQPNTIAAMFRRVLPGLAAALVVVASAFPVAFAGTTGTTTPSPIPLSNLPLVLVTPAHPQVLMLLGNSQSMDGNLSGAIMTGSGTVSGLSGSSSPVDYTVPSGFTPPVQGAAANGTAPYTVNQSGTLVDNSDSRLNVAKQAIQQTLNSYSQVTDFGLMTFDTSGSPGLYNTWVYYMSQSGGFTFTNTQASDTVANPCYQSSSSACSSIDSYYQNKGVSGALTEKYIVVSSTSDDPSINDVLYAGGGLPGVFVTYNGPNPSSPYSGYTLQDYEQGNVYEGYKNTAPNIGSFGTSPTNAGFVPFSDEVMYAQRGFGYYNGVTNRGRLLVQVGQNAPSVFSGYLQPETNNPSSGEIKANAINATIAGMLKSADQYYSGNYSYNGTNYPTPQSSNGCPPKQYVVLITDGLPTLDLNGNAWPPLGSAAATGYGVTWSQNANGVLTSTNNQAVNDALAQIQALSNNGIKTYVVGLGAGVDPTKNPAAAATLRAMAQAGGTGTYFPATTPAQVATDLGVILGQIQSANLATTSASVDSTRLSTAHTVYQSRFNPADSPYNDWTGDLLAYPISSGGTINTAPGAQLWSAQALLDSQNWDTGRQIVTYDPSTGQGVPFRWPQGNTPGIDSTQQGLLMTSSTDTQGPARLDYLRGDRSNEQHNGGTFRDRSHVLGDIVDSNPLFVGAPNGPYPDTSYQTFKANNAGRSSMIYVGANDGMLHAFDATTGHEQFAFVPNGVFDHLINLTDPNYNTGHRFYVDGSPASGDVQFTNGSWHTIVVGGLNNGGSSIYALDVTYPSAMTTESGVASDVLWEFTDPDLGQTYSRPVVTRIPWGNGGVKSVVIFGSGYNNSSQTPYLYVVDAETGTLLQKLDLCSGQPSSVCDTSKPNGLSSPSAVYPNGDGLASQFYAGDLQGNLWRITPPSGTNGNTSWTVTPIFKAEDANGNPQPITVAPVVTFHPLYPSKTGFMVYFGTGKLLGAPDVTDTSPQSFYGVWDDNSGSTYTRSNLVQQTISTVTLSQPIFNGQTQVRLVSQNTINWSTKKGWYMDLPLPGERAITDPVLEDGRVIFTTFVPSTNQCSGGGQSWLMVVDYSTGGAFTRPEIDLNADNVLDSADQVSPGSGQPPQSPAGVSMGNNYSSSPTVLGAHQGDNGDVKLVSQSTGAIQSVKERGGIVTGRLSWRQLQ